MINLIVQSTPQNEQISGAIRIPVKMYPPESIREIVANALIHQDFSVHGDRVMIEIYADRIEISDPGDPIVPIERFIDANQSRNTRLADIMRTMKFCEERGSGIDRVFEQVELYQLPSPSFETGHRKTVVKLFSLKPFSEMSSDERVRACYQHCCLRYVTNQRMTNSSLRSRFGLEASDSVTCSKIINATIASGKIKLDPSSAASKKMAKYLPSWA
jgi:predicted HTH transcriptional regulator